MLWYEILFFMKDLFKYCVRDKVNYGFSFRREKEDKVFVYKGFRIYEIDNNWVCGIVE